MNARQTTESAELDELRKRTFAIAYRMTGSVADAEDIARFRRERATPTPAATVNSQPAQLQIAPDGTVTDVLTTDAAEGKIQAIRIVRNPDRLRHLHPERA
jgi:hypothetical protein